MELNVCLDFERSELRRAGRRLSSVLIFLSAVCLGSHATANDTAFGGNGAALMPIETTEIEMVAEKVVMRADEEKNRWDVTCDFTFRNHSDEPVELKVGFPFPDYDPEEEMGDYTLPEGAKMPKPGEPFVWNFEVAVDGERQKSDRIEIEPNVDAGLYYDHAWVWDVVFPPGETTKIRNTFHHGMTRDSMGFIHAAYVLKSGAMWRGGEIGRSQLEVHAPADWIVNTEAGITPDGQRVDYGDEATRVTWDLKDFAPSEDLFVSFISREALAQQFISNKIEYEDLETLSDADLRLYRNAIYAHYGYVFRDDALSEHFAKSWWYVPDEDFSPDDIPEAHMKHVFAIRAEEKRRDAE